MYGTRLFGNLLRYYFHNKELDELYAAVAIKSFAESIGSIFVPIFLYNLGFGFRDIAIYFLIAYTMLPITMPFAMVSCKRYGIKKTISIGIVFLVIFYLILNLIPKGMPYGIAALLFGLSGGFFWGGFHVDFSKSVDHKREAREFSLLRVLVMIFSALGPIVGALLIKNLSYASTFVVVSFMMLVSITPLFLTKDTKIGMKKISFKKIFKADRKEKAYSYLGYGFLSISALIIWPLVMYTILKGIVILGAIISTVSVAMVFWYLLVGELADRKFKTTIISGCSLYAITWLFRAFYLTPFGVIFSHVLAQFTGSLANTPFIKLMYSEAKSSRDKGLYFLFREFFLTFGKYMALAILLFSNNYIVLFVTCSGASFLYLYSLKNSKLY